MSLLNLFYVFFSTSCFWSQSVLYIHYISVSNAKYKKKKFQDFWPNKTRLFSKVNRSSAIFLDNKYSFLQLMDSVLNKIPIPGIYYPKYRACALLLGSESIDTRRHSKLEGITIIIEITTSSFLNIVRFRIKIKTTKWRRIYKQMHWNNNFRISKWNTIPWRIKPTKQREIVTLFFYFIFYNFLLMPIRIDIF